MDAAMNEEEALIRAFIVKRKQDRFVEMLSNPRHRRKATSSLAHFRDLDPRYMVAILPDAHTPEHLGASLRQRGAPDDCHVVSENRELDGKRLPLDEALQQIVGFGYGTLVSCIPGRLAFFEGEGPSDRFILLKSALIT